MTGFDAVILAGGRAQRLGGADKPRTMVGGRRLLDIVLLAVADAERSIVVGEPLAEDKSLPVSWVREEPPGGGPVAALAAGLAHVTADAVVVLAADLPFVSAATVAALLAGPSGVQAVLAVDDEGRDQPLLAGYQAGPLRKALPDVVTGARLRDVVAGLAVARLRFEVHPPPWWDCDTAEQVTQARRWAQPGSDRR